MGLDFQRALDFGDLVESGTGARELYQSVFVGCPVEEQVQNQIHGLEFPASGALEGQRVVFGKRLSESLHLASESVLEEVALNEDVQTFGEVIKQSLLVVVGLFSEFVEDRHVVQHHHFKGLDGHFGGLEVVVFGEEHGEVLSDGAESVGDEGVSFEGGLVRGVGDLGDQVEDCLVEDEGRSD